MLQESVDPPNNWRQPKGYPNHTWQWTLMIFNLWWWKVDTGYKWHTICYLRACCWLSKKDEFQWMISLVELVPVSVYVQNCRLCHICNAFFLHPVPVSHKMVFCSCSKTRRRWEIQCIFMNLGAFSTVFDMTSTNVDLSIFTIIYFCELWQSFCLWKYSYLQ